MSFKKVTLAGGGVLGSQIAYQTAYKGFDVTIWLRSPESVDRAKSLYANDVADPETIDQTWMLATGAPVGPFRILDVVGLTTAYNIVMNNPQATSDPESTAAKIAAKLKEKIDAGKTGVNAGEGFYKY